MKTAEIIKLIALLQAIRECYLRDHRLGEVAVCDRLIADLEAEMK